MIRKDKFEELRAKYFDGFQGDEVEIITGWQKSYDEARMLKNFNAHPAIKILLKLLEKRIELINQALSNNRELASKDKTDDRVSMFDLRDSYRWFIKLFTNADARMENINKVVDDNLNN